LLIGEFQHNVDQKGRLFVPAKFREELGETFVITRGIGACLFVFSNEEWVNFSKKLRALPMTDRRAQDFLRMLFAGACECEPDKQGRILLPQRLREHAGIEKEVVVIGVMSRMEIWAKTNWDTYNENTYSDFEETLMKMSELGI